MIPDTAFRLSFRHTPPCKKPQPPCSGNSELQQNQMDIDRESATPRKAAPTVASRLSCDSLPHVRLPPGQLSVTAFPWGSPSPTSRNPNIRPRDSSHSSPNTLEEPGLWRWKWFGLSPTFSGKKRFPAQLSILKSQLLPSQTSNLRKA